MQTARQGKACAEGAGCRAGRSRARVCSVLRGTARLTPGRGSDLLRRVQATRGRVSTTKSDPEENWTARPGSGARRGRRARRRREAGGGIDRADIPTGLGSPKPPNPPIPSRSARTRTGAAKGPQGQERTPKRPPRTIKKKKVTVCRRLSISFFFFFFGTTTRPEVGLPLSKMADSWLVSGGTSRTVFKRGGAGLRTRRCARHRKGCA